MKTINLVNKETSDIKFEVSSFPDGQKDIVINPESLEGFKWCWIKARINNMEDLGILICATKALRRLGIKTIHLYIPYLLGARSDRQFQEGGTSYLVDIIAPILNAQNYESITVLDVHSNVAPACINNLKMIDNEKLVRWATNNYQYDNNKKSGSMSEDFILVSPDAGASHKIVKLAEKISYKGDIITCSKERDKDGKLTQTVVPLTKEILITHPSKDYIIIDDICDGGATFINIAKEIKLKIDNWNNNEGRLDRITSKIYLIVTHGIFSKGFAELNQYFDGIYCTNSYKNIPKDYEFGTGSGIFLPDLVKQLNAF